VQKVAAKPLSAKAKARIAIARDVLKQIRSGMFEPTSGVFFRAEAKDRRKNVLTERDVRDRKDLRDVLPKRLKRCEVCAKGALLMSCITKFDNVPVEIDMVGSVDKANAMLDGAANYADFGLSNYFNQQQLDLMESAFEGFRAGWFNTHFQEPSYMLKAYLAIDRYYRGYEDPESRLVAIMKNLIRNKGTFKP
jgi:hypothetical protein